MLDNTTLYSLLKGDLSNLRNSPFFHSELQTQITHTFQLLNKMKHNIEPMQSGFQSIFCWNCIAGPMIVPYLPLSLKMIKNHLLHTTVDIVALALAPVIASLCHWSIRGCQSHYLWWSTMGWSLGIGLEEMRMRCPWLDNDGRDWRWSWSKDGGYLG